MPAATDEFRQHVLGVMQGFPGAEEVLKGIKDSMPYDYGTIVDYLFEHGPRGPNLWERYRDRCGSDALVLGRDLLCQAREFEGWANG